MSIQSPLLLAAGMALLIGTGPVAAQDTAPAPAGVDSASIAAGRLLYQGRGQCVGCHGERGQGTADGPSLIGGPWTLGDGSFPWLLHLTRHAGWGARSREGDPQPMRGPTVLDSAEVRRVAAYVFSISRRKDRPGEPDVIRGE
ncbi:MAG TPA: cytochrome c [Gemmatimonadales bacterium]|nr:cytochrome c [Gemmatimonadales bacterium]